MFLLTRPDHDLITRYLCLWSEVLIKEAEEHSVETVDLPGAKASSMEFVGRLKKLKPKLVLLNGHGNKRVVTGYDNEPLVDTSNAGILKNAVVYARSCSSAAELGAVAVKRGAKAYIGYGESFVMCYDVQKIHKPLEDTVAAHFLEPSNQVVRSLIKGHNAGEASARSKELSRKKMQQLMASNASPESAQYAKFVWHNMRNQSCLGDATAIAIV